MRSHVESKGYMITFPSVLRFSVFRVGAAIPSEQVALSQTFYVTSWGFNAMFGIAPTTPPGPFPLPWKGGLTQGPMYQAQRLAGTHVSETVLTHSAL